MQVAQQVVAEVFETHGRELDTSRVYQNGNCEEVIGRIPAGPAIRVGTKYHPSLEGGPVQQLEQSLHKVAEVLYQAQAAEQAAAGDAGAADGGAPGGDAEVGEDVVDAEYTEEKDDPEKA